MNKKILYMSLSFFLLFSMSVMLVNAQTGTVGVNVGDWYKWDWNVNWSSDNPSATMDDYTKMLMEAEWVKMTIIDISGSIITCSGTSHYKNGTEVVSEQPLTFDVNNSTDILNIFFISPNLGANDFALSTGNKEIGEIIINETLTKTYPDGTRETNYFSFTDENTTNGKTVIGSFDIYWDKSTGVMVETVGNMTQIEGGYTTTQTIDILLDESNVWEVPEFPTWTLLVLASIALVAVITLYKRKLARKTTTNH